MDIVLVKRAVLGTMGAAEIKPIFPAPKECPVSEGNTNSAIGGVKRTHRRETKQRHIVGNAVSAGFGSSRWRHCVSKGLESTAWHQGWESRGMAGARQACRGAVGSKSEDL